MYFSVHVSIEELNMVENIGDLLDMVGGYSSN